MKRGNDGQKEENPMSYDVKCYELAEAFLEDYFTADLTKEKATDLLAQAIQNAIEDSLSMMVDDGSIKEKA